MTASLLVCYRVSWLCKLPVSLLLRLASGGSCRPKAVGCKCSFVLLLQHRDDLEQVRILADQCRRREKLRKRALATWQQNMQALLQQAITFDQQLLGTAHPSPPGKQTVAGAATIEQSSKKRSGSKASHSKGAKGKQERQLAAEIADATEKAQAKFEHDMALSLQLTNGVAEEAGKLHHMKIVRAELNQPEADLNVAGPSEATADAESQEAAQVIQAQHRSPLRRLVMLMSITYICHAYQSHVCLLCMYVSKLTTVSCIVVLSPMM